MSDEPSADTKPAISADPDPGIQEASHEEIVVRPDEYTADEDLPGKARASGNSIKGLAAAVASKAKETTIQKAQELKDNADALESNAISEDAADIQALGGLLDRLTASFEEVMDSIASEPYGEQRRPLVGLKKVLQEEISVINARLALARRMTRVESEVMAQQH
jgi:small-conductance mechanosensitive channel